MMSIPFFRFPTTVVCIDDDLEFLKALTLKLGKEYNIKTFSDPQEALKFLNSKESSPISQMTFIKSVNEHELYNSIHHLPVDFDINEVVKLSNQKNRTDEVAVILLDQNMPGMKGTELCTKLENKELKKILLTGELDHAEAVKAFNDKLIDCFVQKTANNQFLLENLKTYIDIQEEKYFIEKSAHLHNYLLAERALPLSDRAFIDLFHRWCEHHNIKEYYLVDKNGNFLLIDQDGKQFFFIIHTDHSLNTFIEPYEDDDDLTKFIQSIKDRELMPFFGVGIDPDKVRPANWSKCLYNPQVIHGSTNKIKFYWQCVPA
jgi:CheY-like chemotaxis protein